MVVLGARSRAWAPAYRKILLVDHTKFQRRGLYQLAPVTAFDLVIVDAGISASELDTLQASGVEVLVVGPE
ncbi:DeoR/GlpR family DNA-binding transcription regulator [Streptomyces violarus]|uniref:hypothetical protein n=1 Tax=Streptomyces violarus TaxID=67380 RepID=UPI0021C07DE4|nr:hypothetical protein [Streptomyces violarus]MCT9139146.1 hypothetical protein [Streptomyces violarus]